LKTWLVAMTAVLAVPAAAAADVKAFFGAFDCSPVGAKGGRVYAMIDEKALGPAGKDVSKPGQVAFIWGSEQKWTYWGKAAPAGAGVKLTFADRRPVLLEFTRPKPTSEDDYKPFLRLVEEGGRTYQCAFSQE
jgi:hypothetical protein